MSIRDEYRHLAIAQDHTLPTDAWTVNGHSVRGLPTQTILDEKVAEYGSESLTMITAGVTAHMVLSRIVRQPPTVADLQKWNPHLSEDEVKAAFVYTDEDGQIVNDLSVGLRVV